MQGKAKKGFPWDLAAFVAGLCGLSFLYGVAAMAFHWPPYKFLHAAGMAAYSLQLQSMERNESLYTIQYAHDKGGVTVNNPAKTYPGVTLMTLFAGERNVAVLLDMSGKELHRWDASYSEIFPDGDKSMRDANRYFNVAHVYPNGDILLNFEYSGLVKLDKSSKLIWRLNEQTHHALFVNADGSIWVPTRQLQRKTQPFAAYIAPPYFDDQLLLLSADGQVQRRISILKSIFDSHYEGILFANANLDPRVDYEDPLHLNDIEVIPDSAQSRNSGANGAGNALFASGDLLVSLRNLNTLLTLDPKTERIKWTRTGPFLRQHDPDFLPNGNMMVFDNRSDTGQFFRVSHQTEPQAFGYSRVIEFEPASGRVVWEFTGTHEHPFYSSINGMQQTLPNGNLLIVEPEGGRVFELAGRDDPQLVWEYRNSIGGEHGDHSAVGKIGYAQRIDAGTLTFLQDPNKI